MDRGGAPDAGLRALLPQRSGVCPERPHDAAAGATAPGGGRCRRADHPRVWREGTMKVRCLAVTVLAGLLLVSSRSDGGLIYRFVDEAGGVVIFTDNPWQFEVYRRQLNEEPDRNPAATRDDASNEKAAWPRDESARSPRVSSIAQEVIHLAGMDAQVQVLASIAQSRSEE